MKRSGNLLGMPSIGGFLPQKSRKYAVPRSGAGSNLRPPQRHVASSRQSGDAARVAVRATPDRAAEARKRRRSVANTRGGASHGGRVGVSDGTHSRRSGKLERRRQEAGRDSRSQRAAAIHSVRATVRQGHSRQRWRARRRWSEMKAAVKDSKPRCSEV